MTIDFKVNNQTLECTSPHRAAEGTENYIRLKFNFSSDWDGMTKAALMQGRGMKTPVTVYLDANDCCYVPYGVSGVCGISLTGTDGNVTITTDIARMCFEQTLQAGDETDFDNPQSDFSELVRKMNDLKAEIYGNVGDMLAEKADKTAVEETENNIDIINKALTGVYKNKGNVTEMTIDLPLTDDSLINNMYNVKSGFVPSGEYGKNGAFRYRINISEAYISEETKNLCFKLTDIPRCLWSGKISGNRITFDQSIGSVNFAPNTSSNWIYSLPSELPLGSSDTIAELSQTSYSGTPPEVYFADKVFTEGKYRLENIETIWYRDDIKNDDNFAINEDGYDLLTYKVSDYVSKATFDNLSEKVNSKADMASVYTKEEANRRTMLKAEVSGYPAVIGENALAGEPLVKCNVYGSSQTVGVYNTSSGKYSINLICTNKNFLSPTKQADVYSKNGVTFTLAEDGTVTADGTAENNITGTMGIMYKTVGMPPGTYHLSGCPQGGSADTYMLSLTPTGNKDNDTGDGLTFETTSYKTTVAYIVIKKDTVLDNVVFKPQIECGSTGGEYAEHMKSTVQIVFDNALGEGEYIDVINKKRYGGANAGNVTISGELTTMSGVNYIYAATGNSPSKIEAEYYCDIGAEFDNLYTKAEVDEIISSAVMSGSGGGV